MNFKIVKVIWRDARTLTGTSTLEELKKSKLSLAHTIGYLVHQDKDKVAICDFCYETEEDEYADGFRDVHLIPKSWIKDIIILREVKR